MLLSTAYSSIKRLAQELTFIKRQSKRYLTLIWVGILGVRFVLKLKHNYIGNHQGTVWQKLANIN